MIILLKKIPSDKVGKMVKHLDSVSHGMDTLLLMLDCDAEGENICFEVMDCVKHNLKLHGNYWNSDKVYRAKFSSLAKQDILKSFEYLYKPDKNMSDSVDTRQELDLKIGCAFTR